MNGRMPRGWDGSMSRRRWLALAGLSGLMASVGNPALAQLSLRSSRWQRPRELGMTFSPLQCYYLGIDDRAAFKALCGLGLDRVRLGAYWHEIEAVPGRYDFSKLDWLLEESARHNLKVTIALGMKAPRWPEFHFPEWVKNQFETGAGSSPLDQRSPAMAEHALTLVDAVVRHCRQSPGVTHWQVENEPFTRLEITGGRWLSPGFVGREVGLVRSLKLESQRILLTNAIHLPSPKVDEDEPAFQDSLKAADAVGFNVYTKVPAGPPDQYIEPTPLFWQQLEVWQRELGRNDRESWIAEAQAEPWEPGQLVATQKLDYPSASPRRMRSLVETLGKIGYGTVLLWGSEYWYWQRLKGRNLWWWTVGQMARRDA